MLATTAADKGTREKDVAMLRQAGQAAERIAGPNERAARMLAVAGDLATLGYVRDARGIALAQSGDEAKSLTLATVLEQALTHR